MTISIQKWLMPALVLLVCFACAAPARAAYIAVTVDGQAVSFDQPPVVSNGHVLVPLRGIFERLGAHVDYHAATSSITATRGSTTVDLTLGSTQARVNGNPVTLETPAQEMNGRTLVPLRFVSEALGAQVGWNAGARTVAVNSVALPPSTSISPPPSATAPPPATLAPPTISGVYTSGLQALNPGDTLTVEADGTPGSTATFDLIGLATGNGMAETSPGHYVGTMTVSNTMRSGSATVVVHLTHNGQTASLPAANPVTIGYGSSPGYPPGYTSSSPSGYPPVNGNALTAMDIWPRTPAQLGQTVTITARGVPGGIATMDLDGRTGIPMSEAQPGVYRANYTVVSGDDLNSRVVVNLRLPNGAVSSLASATTLAQGYGGTYGSTYPTSPGTLFVTVSSPQAGQRIDGDFTVTGNTLPYAAVLITAAVKRPLIPGVINLSSRTVTAQGQADANGNYSVLVPVGNVPRHGNVSLNVEARDQYGNTSQPVQFDVATGP